MITGASLGGCEAQRESKAGSIESSLRRVKGSMENLESILGRLIGDINPKSAEPTNCKVPQGTRPEFALWNEIGNEMYSIAERIDKAVAILTENMI